MNDVAGIEIDVTIIQGEGLVAKDRNLFGKKTTSDPYIKVHHGGNQNSCHTTAVISANLNPVWNESFKIHAGYQDMDKSIVFYLYDRDELTEDDKMGCVVIPVPEYTDKPPCTDWFPVQKTWEGNEEYNCPKAKGRVKISLAVNVRKYLNMKRGNSNEVNGKMQVKLNWELEGSHPTDLDTSCVAIDSFGNILMDESVYFGDLVNSNRSILHSGDALSGGGKGEVIDVDLVRIRPFVRALYFVLSVATPGRTFVDVESADVVIREMNGQSDIMRFTPTFSGQNSSMFLCRIARTDTGGWRMTIIEDTDHTARDFGSLIPEIKGYSRDLVPGIEINPSERIAILRKGGAIMLRGDIPEPLTFGLAWDVTDGVNIDLDASVICLDASLKLIDIVAFNHLQSNDNAIKHGGDEREGDALGDDEKIKVWVNSVNPCIKHIGFVINSFSGQELDDVSKASCHLFDPETGVDIARHKIANNGDLDKHTALLVASLYRSDEGSWCLRIISEAAQGRIAKELVDEFQNFLMRNPPPPITHCPEPEIILNEMPEDVDIVIEKM
mmetsp:Transcript_7062/g.8171  ORF Transcript_7062/g.8171 Transcript_7062/m.8171 type:complete len:554 (+) Transcript_7062:47-1708(+)